MVFGPKVPPCFSIKVASLCRRDDVATRASVRKLAGLLRECTAARDLQRGKSVHERMVELGVDSDRFHANLLVEMYGKCGDVENARKIFHKMADRNVFSWNMLITAYAQNGHTAAAVAVFRGMDLEGMKPTAVTLVSVIASVADLGLADLAMGVCERVEACGFDTHVVVASALIAMHARCSRLDDARDVFDRLGDRRNVVSWTSMIQAYARNGRHRDALELFLEMEMEKKVAANAYTIASAAEACGGCGSVEQARKIVTRAVAGGFDSVRAVAVAVTGMLCKLGYLDEARRWIQREQIPRSVFCWNQVVAALCARGETAGALHLYRAMSRDHGVEPDTVTFVELLAVCSEWELGQELRQEAQTRGFGSDLAVCSAVVTMCGRCGQIDAARHAFDAIAAKNIVSWTTMMAAYAHNGLGGEAIQLFRSMELEGIKPTYQTLTAVANTIALLGDLTAARSLHIRAIATGFELTGVFGNAVIDMYGKSKSPEEARRAFVAMSSSSRTAGAWTSMIAAYAHSGCRDEAFALFREMARDARVEATGMTFVSVLAACEGSSDLETGRAIHRAAAETGLDSDVFVGTALVDMYGKCEDVDAARTAFDAILVRNVISWNAMLGVYVQNGCASAAMELFDRMDVEPDKVSFVLALEALAALGDLRRGRELHRRGIPRTLLDTVCVRNALVRMYALCGAEAEARSSFDAIRHTNLASWSAIIGALASLGRWRASLDFFSEMTLQGQSADESILTGILSECSHLGLREQGWRIFVSMLHDFGVAPSSVHYVCIVDVLGRLGQLEEAENLIRCMPFEPGFVAWMTLLGSCGTHGDVLRGMVAARRAFALNERNTAANYILLCNMCTAMAGE